jgi:adenylylsulfate kinase
MKRILICGLPGSGKTFLASRLVEHIPDAVWLNADKVRQQHNDWDFSSAGRTRQMNRMKVMSTQLAEQGVYVICDFVCPTQQLRSEFGADLVIWMDTIDEGRFADTNAIFEKLDNTEYHVIITTDQWWNEYYAKDWIDKIVSLIYE